jgi:heparinase II/III-like protein
VNLAKLRRASLQELRVRAAQRVAAFSERRGWSSLVKLPPDDARDWREYFRSRSEPSFFAGFHTPEKTVAAFKSRWPNIAQRLVEKADRIGEGKFDLLGFRNLSFGHPIDWQFEPVSGKRIPLQHWSKLDYLDAEIAGDKKIIWELNRHQYFMTLGQAYLLTGDERYARVFATHLDSWMDANPPKLGINWASSLEVAFRSMSWLWGFYFFKSSPSLSTETFKRAWKFLYLSARHLESYLSTYFSPNTHLTGEALGLFYLGTLLPDFKEAKRWQELGRRILIEQLPIHVRRDGVYFEQSSYYHRYTTDFYIHFLLLSRANKIALPHAVEETLIRLLDHLMYITRPDGTTPLFGDDDGGRLAQLDDAAANDFRSTLATGAVLFDRGDYKTVSADAAEELLWLTGADGLSKFDAIVATEPAKTSVPFFDGGYFVMRDGWSRESNYLLFDCGPHGSLNCGHAHADALSIDVAANGRTVLVDPGTCTYTGSKELRDWFRSSQAHNTLTLDDVSSSLPAGPFTWNRIAQCSLRKWIGAKRFDFVSGQHDGYLPAIVKREILFIKGDYWIVRDTVASPGEHRVDVRFHYEPGTSLRIECFGNGHWVEEEAFVSHCYGQKEAAKALSFSATLKGGGEIVSFLLPPKPATDWVVKELEAQEARAFEVRGANTVDLVIMPIADAWVWTRSIDGVSTEQVTIE